LDEAIEAITISMQKDPSYLLVVIGDGPEKAALSKRAQELNIQNRVFWLGAIYNQAEMAPWFLSALAFIYPGAIGLSLLHAFAYGLPVITHCNAQYHNPEFAALKNRFNGLTFREGDVNDLAEKLLLLGDRPDFAKLLGANALKMIQQQYSLKNMVDRFVKAVSAASDIALHKT